MPGVRLSGCLLGNGTGVEYQYPDKRAVFCECAVCRCSRWMRMKSNRGQLAPAQEETVRELIRHLGGDA